MRIEGELPLGVTAKDVILATIGEIGTDGATGYAIEYTGSTIRSLSMEARMTICNMSIEAGGRVGMVAPDDTTFAYLEERPPCAKGPGTITRPWRAGVLCPPIRRRPTTRRCSSTRAPWRRTLLGGPTPGMVVPVTGQVPDPASFAADADRRATERALEYMALTPGTAIEDIAIDRVFIGSCTNARLEDLRAAARMVRGRRVHDAVRAMVVPGSGVVKWQAEAEGLDAIFEAAGFEWRDAGCSMCLGMNPDILAPGERCASTSNRNFEGRQGKGGRTHLVSPEMAAAAATTGHFVDIRAWE